MKIVKSKPLFSPITLTIETQTEFDWLRALSNAAVSEAKASAKSLGFEIEGDSESIDRAQMAFYNAMQSAANS
jgi:hypothetical protein